VAGPHEPTASLEAAIAAQRACDERTVHELEVYRAYFDFEALDLPPAYRLEYTRAEVQGVTHLDGPWPPTMPMVKDEERHRRLFAKIRREQRYDIAEELLRRARPRLLDIADTLRIPESDASWERVTEQTAQAWKWQALEARRTVAECQRAYGLDRLRGSQRVERAMPVLAGILERFDAQRPGESSPEATPTPGSVANDQRREPPPPENDAAPPLTPNEQEWRATITRVVTAYRLDHHDQNPSVRAFALLESKTDEEQAYKTWAWRIRAHPRIVDPSLGWQQGEAMANSTN
jgi:hypothetical protein